MNTHDYGHRLCVDERKYSLNPDSSAGTQSLVCLVVHKVRIDLEKIAPVETGFRK